MKKQNHILLASITLLGAIFATSCQKKQEAAVKTVQDNNGLVIRSSMFSGPAYDTQLWLAVQTGIFGEEFDKDNIKVDLIPFLNGPAANEALIAGQLDLVHAIGDQPMITGIAAGSNGIALACQSRQSDTQGIYVGSNSSIKNVQDLRGKRIGVGIGTFTHKCLVGVLEEAGIREDEVELLNLTTFDVLYSAYEKGSIDAFVSNFVSVYDLLKEDSVRQVADFSSHPAYTFLVGNKKFVNAHPDVVQRLVNVLVRTELWEKENPEKAAELVASFTGLPVEGVSELRSLTDLTIDITDYDKKQIEWTYSFLKKHEYLADDIKDLSTIYDDSYVKKARASIITK